jgi:hypothetical protein
MEDAAYSAAYSAAWDPIQGRHGGVAYPADPSYPSVTGTLEYQQEGDDLGAAGQLTSWNGTYNFTKTGEAAATIVDQDGTCT